METLGKDCPFWIKIFEVNKNVEVSTLKECEERLPAWTEKWEASEVCNELIDAVKRQASIM